MLVIFGSRGNLPTAGDFAQLQAAAARDSYSFTRSCNRLFDQLAIYFDHVGDALALIGSSATKISASVMDRKLGIADLRALTF